MGIYITGMIVAFVASILIFCYDNYRANNKVLLEFDDIKFALVGSLLSWIIVCYLIAFVVYEYQKDED